MTGILALIFIMCIVILTGLAIVFIIYHYIDNDNINMYVEYINREKYDVTNRNKYSQK